MMGVSPDSERFREMPPLTSDEVVEWKAGESFSLVLLEHLPDGGSALFDVDYIHRELTYRTPGQKDAVAFGTARLLDGTKEYRDARMLFSRPNQSATLRGLVLEGNVKLRWRNVTLRKERDNGCHG